MRKITTDELFDVLRYETEGRFYSVTFERRTTRRNRTARAGELRTMLCKTGAEMASYKLGIVSKAARDAEDLKCAVLTVWSVGDYARLRRIGFSQERAGFGSWRRIDLTSVVKCSLLENTDFPPIFNDVFHEITNQFRLRHIPRRF